MSDCLYLRQLAKLLTAAALVAGCAGKTNTASGTYINGQTASDYYASLTYGQDPVTHKYRVLTTSEVGIKATDSTHLLYATMLLYLMPSNQFTNDYSECSVDTSAGSGAPCTPTGQSTVQTGGWTVSGDTIVLDHLGTGQSITENGANGFSIGSLTDNIMTAGLAGESADFLQTLQTNPGP